jgi:tetratricopeptide (TPR) repeat protein
LDVRSAIDRIIRREARIFAGLCVIAIIAFLATRSLAAHNRRTSREDAAQWHALGVASLHDGRAAEAVEQFRRASRIDRDNRTYRFALADALHRTGDNDAALDVLLRLRESVPDDVEINASLARLEAGRGAVEDAVRYYQTAILALWPPSRIDQRRALRIELIEILLAHGAGERALSEVLKLSGEISDQPGEHVRVAQLLLRAGSPARAEAQFVAALRRSPHDMAALAGAGSAAFAAGDYEHARDYLRRIPGGTDNELLRISQLVLDLDPLMPRLTARDRDRRLARAVDELQARAAGCTAATEAQQELAAMQPAQVGARATSADTPGPDLARVAALARDISRLCPPAQPIDRAVVLIAARHGLDAS